MHTDDLLSPKHLKDDTEYTLNGGDLYLLCEETMFRVHSFFFLRESPIFREWMDKPPPDGQPPNGTTPTTAIVLDGVKPEELRIFLWCFYNPKYSLYDAPVENWKTILALSHHWQFTKLRSFAIDCLQKKEMSPVDRLLLYQEYDVEERFLVPLYVQLCAQEDPLSIEDSFKLGLRPTVVIFQTRERLRAPKDDGKSPLPDMPKVDVIETVQAMLQALPPLSSSGRLRNGIRGDAKPQGLGANGTNGF